MIAEKINISDKFGKLPAGDYAVGVIVRGCPIPVTFRTK